MPNKTKATRFAASFAEISVNKKPMGWPELKKVYEELKREPVGPEYSLAVVDGKVCYCRIG